MKKLAIVPNKSETIAGYIFLAVQLLVLQPALVIVNLILPVPMSDTTLNIVYFVINFLCVAIIFHRYLIRSGKEAFSAPLRCFCNAFLAFIGYWLASIFVSSLIYGIYPDFSNANDEAIDQMVQDNFPIMALGTVLLVPITEEVLYRGLIFGKIYNRSRVLAYLVSTAAFAALHVVGYIGMYEPKLLLLSLLQYLPAGLCLGWAYARTGSIWTSISIHIAINLIAMLSMR